MPLRTVCCFSHLTDRDAHWEDAHYSVKKFVDALKGRPINKHAYLQVDAGAKRRLEQANADDAVSWFGEMGAQILEDEGIENPVLIPFPSSKCDVRVRTSKTRRLADAIAENTPATVLDALRFKEPQPSANGEGGTRDPEEIYPHLQLTKTLIKRRKYVLVDDVATSGGHLRAAAALLRRQGVDVVLAVTGVSSDREPSDDPFERVERTLPDYQP